MATVTVCIPTYRSRWLAESIGSALSQTFRDLRVIVLDDGDGSAEEVCARFRDPRLTYRRNSGNLGMVRNWNQCLDLADGIYLAILHDDDAWEPMFLQRMTEALEETGAAFAFSAATVMDGEGRPKRLHRPWRRGRDFAAGELFRVLLKGNVILCPTVLLRRAALAGRRFDARFGYATDWRFWLDLARTDGARYVPQPLARYREASGNVTGSLDSHRGRDMRVREALAIIQDAGQGTRGRTARAMKAGVAKHLAMLAINDEREGIRSGHLRRARRAKALSPWVFLATLYRGGRRASKFLGPSVDAGLTRLERRMRRR